MKKLEETTTTTETPESERLDKELFVNRYLTILYKFMTMVGTSIIRKREKAKTAAVSFAYLLSAKDLENIKCNVSEVFTSLCGEGTEIGELATFIRMSGCNMRCQYPCDTLYALDKGTTMSLLDMYIKIEDLKVKKLFWTGGEYTLQDKNLYELIRKLKYDGYYQIAQSNGTKYSDTFKFMDLISLDFKGPSAGADSVSDENVIKKTIEELAFYIPIQIKFLIKDGIDYVFTKEKIEWLSHINGFENITIILGAVGGINLNPLAEKFIIDTFWHSYSNVKLLPQLHVLIWGRKRGV